MNAMTVRTTAAEARDHPAVGWSVRLGFAVYGVVYVVIAWLTAQVALGDRGEDVSKNGALRQLADQPLGRSLLWVVAAGFAALVVWEVCQVLVGHRDRRGWRRWAAGVGSAFRGAVFASFGVTAARIAADGSSSGGSSSGSSRGWTARVLDLPLGPAIVIGVGLGVCGYALVSIGKGLTDKWRDELDLDGRTGRIGRAMTALARAGYVSRGVAFGLVGGMLAWAGATHDPGKGGGLDTALGEVSSAPLGPVLLLAVAAGLACYGLFNIAKARHLRGA